MSREPSANPGAPDRPGSPASGFTLVELLVALAVFATMAALAYGGLNSISRTREELAAREAAFSSLMRAVNDLNRDLREAVARPVRGNFGQILPALVGTPEHIEFTRLGFANPQAEPRSNLERVLYELDSGSLKRGRFAVLDRAPGTQPQIIDLHVKASDLRLRYLDRNSNRWLDSWPPPAVKDMTDALPRAVRWQFRTKSDGEISGTVELVSAWPKTGAGPVGPSGNDGSTPSRTAPGGSP